MRIVFDAAAKQLAGLLKLEEGWLKRLYILSFLNPWSCIERGQAGEMAGKKCRWCVFCNRNLPIWMSQSQSEEFKTSGKKPTAILIQTCNFGGLSCLMICTVNLRAVFSKSCHAFITVEKKIPSSKGWSLNHFISEWWWNLFAFRFCLSETSCPQEDHFPPNLCVKVNGKPCSLPVSKMLFWYPYFG